MMESSFSAIIPPGYRARVSGADLVSPDGREAYEIKLVARGVRDLRDAALRLATFLAGNPAVERGYVLASLIRISAARLRKEWHSIMQVLLPDLRGRMYLVAVVGGTEIAEPAALHQTIVIKRFLEVTRKRSGRSPSSVSNDDTRTGNPAGLSWKHLEIEKVLLHRWLLKEGPIAVGTLGRQVGCSFPTTIQAIRRLTANEVIERARSRTIALSRYPRDRWLELFRAQRLIYPPVEFVDPAAEPGAVDGILRRFHRLDPKEAAIGGVVAARRWQPSFDLNGIPRIDIVLHTPAARAPHNGDWIRQATEFALRLDPALKRRSPNMNGATVLVMHHTFRKDPLFLNEPQRQASWADPVEVLYHLNELGLTAQAGQLLRHLRQEAQS